MRAAECQEPFSRLLPPSAKARNWRKAKKARKSSIFSSRHPPRQPIAIGGRGRISREKVKVFLSWGSLGGGGFYDLDCVARRTHAHTHTRTHAEESVEWRGKAVGGCLAKVSLPTNPWVGKVVLSRK